MKIILLQDVAKIGRKNAVISVPDGYAQNQLIPKGMAKPATPENLKAIERLQADVSAEAKAIEERFFKTKEALKDKEIVVKGLKSDNGHLFAALKKEEIVKAAKDMEIELDPAFIHMDQAIKTTGEHQIELAHKDHKTTFNITIE